MNLISDIQSSLNCSCLGGFVSVQSLMNQRDIIASKIDAEELSKSVNQKQRNECKGVFWKKKKCKNREKDQIAENDRVISELKDQLRDIESQIQKEVLASQSSSINNNDISPSTISNNNITTAGTNNLLPIALMVLVAGGVYMAKKNKEPKKEPA